MKLMRNSWIIGSKVGGYYGIIFIVFYFKHIRDIDDDDDVYLVLDTIVEKRLPRDLKADELTDSTVVLKKDVAFYDIIIFGGNYINLKCYDFTYDIIELDEVSYKKCINFGMDCFFNEIEGYSENKGK